MGEHTAEKDAPRRPLRTRVWFWKPSWYFSWYWDPTQSLAKRIRRILVPFFTGGDEFDWHTIGFGWTITGRVIIATRHCPGTGKCAESAADGLAAWPVDAYGFDWSNGRPTDADYEALDAEPCVLPPGGGRASEARDA